MSLPVATATPSYPLSALVGQEDLVEALLVCAVAPAVGGVLVRGERGTAKSTAVRALAPMLAEDQAGSELAARAAPLVEVPLGATLDRLVGSLDVRAAMGGEHRVDPGLLARADGGVLYVDEVNLLGDHLVDALLDAAAAGRVVVERDGISVVQPARFLLVGTMNPEEGELRPQLLDRFGLGVEVAGPRDPSVRAEIVRRRMAFDADPAAFVEGWAEAERAVGERLTAARECLPAVRLSDRMLGRITATCAQLELDGIRGDLVCAHAARALAALAGAAEVEEAHVARAAHLALSHRLRRDPLAPPPAPGDGDPAIDEALSESQAASDAADRGPSGPAGDGAPEGAPAPPPWQPSPELAAAPRPADERMQDAPSPRVARSDAIASRIPADALTLTRPVRGGQRRGSAPLATAGGRARGGKLAVIDARPAAADEPVAALPTLLAALRGERGPMAAIHGGGRSAHVVLVVDTSGSMAAGRRLARVKGAVEATLRTSYARRDRVTVVAFSGTGATTLVAAGTPLEQAAAAVAQLPAGGRTPLAAGLEHAAAIVTGRHATAPGRRSGVPEAGHASAAASVEPLPADGRARLVLVLTDGRAADPDGRAALALTRIVEAADRTVVVDLEDGRARLGLAVQLARRAGADVTRLVAPIPTASRSAA